MAQRQIPHPRRIIRHFLLVGPRHIRIALLIQMPCQLHHRLIRHRRDPHRTRRNDQEIPERRLRLRTSSRTRRKNLKSLDHGKRSIHGSERFESPAAAHHEPASVTLRIPAKIGRIKTQPIPPPPHSPAKIKTPHPPSVSLKNNPNPDFPAPLLASYQRQISG